MREEYEDADSLFRAMLTRVVQQGHEVVGVTDPTSVGSKFGKANRPTTECLAPVFVLRNPRARIVGSRKRNADLAFSIANTIWTLSGSDDVHSIGFYNHRGIDFSDDGKHFAGAVGRRLFRSEQGDQFEGVVRTLRADPSSRRAVMQIFSPSDSLSPPRDTPCSLSLQFFIRDGKLISLTYMRSQSALMVFPYDLFLFTMIHEMLAVELGLSLGCYIHACGSLHFYNDEISRVMDVLNEPAAPPTPAMPSMTNVVDRAKLLDAEASLRRRLAAGDLEIDCSEFGLDQYWTTLLQLLATNHMGKIRCRADVKTCPSLTAERN